MSTIAARLRRKRAKDDNQRDNAICKEKRAKLLKKDDENNKITTKTIAIATGTSAKTGTSVRYIIGVTVACKQ